MGQVMGYNLCVRGYYGLSVNLWVKLWGILWVMGKLWFMGQVMG